MATKFIRSLATAVLARGVVLAAAFAVAGCSLDKATAPSEIGPSGHALSVRLTATPDILPRNGEAMSEIKIAVYDAQGAPKGGQRLALFADAGSLSLGEVVTGSGGEARVTFVAPEFNVYSSEAVVSAIPVGDNFANSRSSSVKIALLGPEAPVVPAAPVAIFEILPAAPTAGKAVAFDAGKSTVGAGATIDRYYWTFGDGDTEETGVSATVKRNGYPEGAYVVTLTITDSLGRQNTTAKTFEVKAATVD